MTLQVGTEGKSFMSYVQPKGRMVDERTQIPRNNIRGRFSLEEGEQADSLSILPSYRVSCSPNIAWFLSQRTMGAGPNS